MHMLATVLLLIQLGWPTVAEQSISTNLYSGTKDFDNHGNIAYVSKVIQVSKESSYGSTFNCRVRNPGRTNNVNKLSPFNVEVVAALGDSITAGFAAGAKNGFRVLWEYKGISWSIGGKSKLSRVTTLPNILKEFNPKLSGFSKKTVFGRKQEELNRAKTGAEVKQLLRQARELVRLLRQKRQMRKWKVITIFIGGNDLCEPTCRNKESVTVRNFMRDLNKAIRYLAQNVRYAFINLALLLDMSILAPVRGASCFVVHNLTCSCATKKNRRKVSRVAKRINREIVRQFQYRQPYDRRDFAVVVQPMYSNTKLPYKTVRRYWWRRNCRREAKLQFWNRLRRKKTCQVPDKSYLAPDCFHFSQKGHTLAAKVLWNNMLEPVGRKTTGVQWGQEVKLICPSRRFPYFRTNRNSKLSL